jgi:hypothetical protein
MRSTTGMPKVELVAVQMMAAMTKKEARMTSLEILLAGR